MNGTQATNEQGLLSLESAADLLCVSKSTMYRLLDQGRLHGMKAGKQWRFRREDLMDYMQRGPTALALENIPAEIIDAELAFFDEQLAKADVHDEEINETHLNNGSGKIEVLFRKIVRLTIADNGIAGAFHLEPVWEKGTTSIVLRIPKGGCALKDVRRIPSVLGKPIAMECKRLAGLQIDEHDRPQNGHIMMTFGDMQVTIWVAIIPTVYGERIAMRFAPIQIPTLQLLGTKHGSRVKDYLQSNRGLVLISGPTGSGKSTTMFACVQEFVDSERIIISIQHPIIYMQQGITQIQLEKFSRAEAMRAVLDQEPNIIVAGELAGEPELAQEVFRAVETGHMVFATIHAHDAITPLFEFAECGIKRSLIASNLNVIANQHLLRGLCIDCKVKTEPSADLLSEVYRAAKLGGYAVPESTTFYSAVGCEKCDGSGHRRMLPVLEYFSFTPELRTAFTNGASKEELARLAHKPGDRSTFAEAVSRAVEGDTSLEEVIRVTMPEWQ